MNMPPLVDAVKNIHEFEKGSLKDRLNKLEKNLEGAGRQSSQYLCEVQNITSILLASAFALKMAAGQIHEIVHAIGILISLPYILGDDECISSISLGAGNTGRAFDLETNYRVAEFKFIQWKGGAESIRQNSIFKDFYLMAESDIPQDRYLYVVGNKYPLKFFNGGRALSSVLSKNLKLWEDLKTRYGKRFSTVGDYYNYRKQSVNIIDILEIVPGISELFDA